MSLIADVCSLMTTQAYNKALNKLYAMDCGVGDLGTTVLHHFRLTGACSDSTEICCITDYVSEFVLEEDTCSRSYSCANLRVSESVNSCGEISIIKV